MSFVYINRWFWRSFSVCVTMMISSVVWAQSQLASQGEIIENLIPESALVWLRYELAYHEIWQWLALVLGVVFVMIAKRLLLLSWSVVQSLTSATHWQWDDQLIEIVKEQVIAIASLGCAYLYILAVGYTDTFTQVCGYGIKVLVAFHIFRLLYRVMDVIPDLLKSISHPYLSHLDPAVTSLAVKIGKFVVAILLPLVILQNFGINVASVLAGLGLAGLAFSLAAKDMAANFLGSLMILLDKPFDLGDWVIIGDYEGSIAEIGIRSTQIRTFYDSIITIPNSVITNVEIDNMGKRNYRRIKTTIEMSYATTPDQMTEFLSSIRALLKNHAHTVKMLDQHVVLSEFKDSSFGVMLYFFIDVKDWTEELLVRENIFLSIVDLAAKHHVEFAFPTRTIHLQNKSDPHHNHKESAHQPPESIETDMITK